jgi:hypothetical protein
MPLVSINFSLLNLIVITHHVRVNFYPDDAISLHYGVHSWDVMYVDLLYEIGLEIAKKRLAAPPKIAPNPLRSLCFFYW